MHCRGRMTVPNEFLCASDKFTFFPLFTDVVFEESVRFCRGTQLKVSEFTLQEHYNVLKEMEKVSTLK